MYRYLGLIAVLFSAAACATAAENLALGRPYTLSPEPDYPYCKDDGDLTDLTDAVTDNCNWVKKTTVGWGLVGSKLIEIEIDLGQVCAIEAVSFATVAGAADVTFPMAVMVFVSDNGNSYDYVTDVINEAPSQASSIVHTFVAEDLDTRGRFVRLGVVRGGWYCFCDEVEVLGQRLDVSEEELQERRWTSEEVSERATELIPVARQKNSSLTLLRIAQEALDRDGNRYAEAATECRTQLAELRDKIMARREAEQVDYRRGIPYTSLDRSICYQMGKYLAATGRDKGLVVWPAPPWASLFPFDWPTRADTGEPFTSLLQGEWGELALNLTNTSARPLEAEVSIESLSGPDGEVSADGLRLREVVYVEAFGFRVKADALVPIRKPLRLPPGMTKQLWITVDSRGLEPGEYEAVLGLDVHNGQKLRPKIAFEVVPVAMPDEPTLTTANFSYFTWPVAQDFPDQVAQNLREHYTNAQCIPNAYIPYPKADAEGNFTEPLDFSGLDYNIELMPETRLWILWPGFEWDYGQMMPKEGDERRAKIFTRWVTDVLDHMREKGYGLDNVAFFWMDEPGQKHMRERVLPSSKLLREIEPKALVWMDITGDNTADSLKEMEPYIDIWCPVSSKANWDFWAGKRLWFYTTASNKGQDPSAYYRYQLWQAFNWGCEGHAFWVYTDRGLLWDDYAGNSPSYSIVYDGPDGVIDSKRWEAYRAGIEDYEVCRMLADAIENARQAGRGDDAEVQAAAEALDDWVQQVLDNRSDPMIAEQAHNELLGHLVSMKSVGESYDMRHQADEPLRRPVVFSYNYPWGSDRNPNAGWTDPWFMDFEKVRLSAANLVDHIDVAKFRAHWRTPARRILARTGCGGEDWSVEQLVTSWDKALRAPGIDGMAMDEFVSSAVTSERMRMWISAIKEIRRLHPRKVLAFWTDNGLGMLRKFGNAHQPLLVALRDYADYVMPEIYYRESAVPDFQTRDDPFPSFRQKVEEWEAAAPGITSKVLMGLGTVQNVDWGYDDRDDVDYAEFLATQIQVCATDPILKRMAGIALYAPGYLTPATLTRVNEAIIRFYHIQN